jgi:hypothetical protein
VQLLAEAQLDRLIVAGIADEVRTGGGLMVRGAQL